MPFDAVCGGCWHHEGIPKRGSYGECRALPPDQPRQIHTLMTVMTYRHTADECPACGLFRPKVEPEPPVAETKAERIARLCKAPVTDLAAFKREIDGR